MRALRLSLLVVVIGRVAGACASPLTVAELRETPEITSFGDAAEAPENDGGDEAPSVSDPIDADDG